MKDSVLKIMLGTIAVNVVITCIFILTKDSYVVALKAVTSMESVLLYAIPFWLYCRIVDDEEYRKLATIGSVLALITSIFNALVVWGLLSQSVFMTKLVYSFNITIWVLAYLSWIYSIRTVNDLLAMLKKVSSIITIIMGLGIGLYIWTGSLPDGFIVKLVYLLIVLGIGAFVSTFISSKFYRKEIFDMELSERSFSSYNNVGRQNNVMEDVIANAVAARNHVTVNNQTTISQPVNTSPVQSQPMVGQATVTPTPEVPAEQNINNQQL